MNNIMVIEDEDALRDIIIFNLEKNGYSTVSVPNANDALIIIEDYLPDIILLDLMLPGLKGQQFLSIIKKNSKLLHIPVIIISAKNNEEDIIKGLQAGADDYLTKPFSINILLARIKTILKRTYHITSNSEYSGISIDEKNYKVFADKKEIILTNKEYTLISYLVKHPLQVFTRNQLLSSIWGYDAEIYTRTVDSHISSLRKKLGDKGRLIKSIPKIGYKLE